MDSGDLDATRGRSRAGRWLVVAIVVFVLGAIGAMLALLYHHVTAAPTSTTSPAQRAEAAAVAAEDTAVAKAVAAVGVKLPTGYAQHSPALPASGFRVPLGAHQVFAYIPYWLLASTASTVDVNDLTTVAYFGVGIKADGSFDEQDPGLVDLGGSQFEQLVTRAHAAGDRVLLTVDSSDETVLDAISASPAPAAAKLLSMLVPALEAHHLDGADLDLEGRNGIDAPGFAHFVALVSAGLRRVNPTWDLAINTYPQSAGDPNDFFDVAAIAPVVDQVFVMAYDMYQPGVPSANAPLVGEGLSVADALQEYTAIVPRSKLILGVPFYGDDWTETNSTQDPGTAAGPTTLTYETIAAGHHVALWDPGTDTVWFSYRYKGHVHQAWFDDPLSLALKASLAEQYRIAGVGIWALGMQGDHPELLQALLGGSQPVKLPLAATAG